MFSFDSLTDEQIVAVQNEGLLPEGEYPFVVKDAIPTTSQSGNPMLQLNLGVLASDGERNITDYLVSTKNMIFKLKHFCETIGFENEYKAGKFDPLKCVGRSGMVKIGVQKGNMKPDGSGFYRDKNNARDYCKVIAGSVEKPSEALFNDDIKF